MLATDQSCILDYKIGKTIGLGTFGKVKRGKHILTDAKVAVKIVNRRIVEERDMSKKYRMEIQCMRKCVYHPHIMRLYEVIDTPRDVFMILEFCPNGDLFEYICQFGSGGFDQMQARRIFQQIIAGVDYLHKQGIVHRDLKPENILIDADDNIKIADMGLSNVMKDGEFLKTCCGSPNYAAPELLSDIGGAYAGPEIDVWSMGCILYALLLGRLPFQDDNITALFRKIKRGIYDLPTNLPKGLATLIPKMLCVNPFLRATIPDIIKSRWFQRNLPSHLLTDYSSHDKAEEIDEDIFMQVMQIELCKIVDRSRAIYAIHHARDLLTMRRYSSADYLGMRRVAMCYTIYLERKIKSEWRFNRTMTEPEEDIPTPLEERETRLERSTPREKRNITPFTFETMPTVWITGIWTSVSSSQLMYTLLQTLKQFDLEWGVESPYHVITRKKQYTSRRVSSSETMLLGIIVPEFFSDYTKEKRIEILNLYKEIADLPQREIVEHIMESYSLSYDQSEDFVQWRRKLRKETGLNVQTNPDSIAREWDHTDMIISIRLYKNNKYSQDISKFAARAHGAEHGEMHRYMLDFTRLSGEMFPFLDFFGEFHEELEQALQKIPQSFEDHDNSRRRATKI